MRILVPVPALPKPDESAGDRRFVALLEMLAANHQVDVCPTTERTRPDDRETRMAALLRSHGVRVLRPGWRSFVLATIWHHYDLAIFEFYWSAEGISAEFRRRQPHAQVVIDSVDVHFARQEAAVDLGLADKTDAAKTRTRELGVYRDADAVIAASQPDADLLLKEGGIAALFVLPIIIAPRERTVMPRGADVLFIGSFRHAPNVDGLRWFLSEIWPRVRRAVPAATFTIVGSGTPGDIVSLFEQPGVRFEGHVADTNPYIDRAAISVAPLRFGAGMKGKVVEALAAALPLVTTSFGVQGLSVTNGRDVEVHDEADAFGDAVVRLLHDPEAAAEMAQRGQAVAEGLCSPRVVSQRVGEMIDGLAALKPARPSPPGRIRRVFRSLRRSPTPSASTRRR